MRRTSTSVTGWPATSSSVGFGLGRSRPSEISTASSTTSPPTQCVPGSVSSRRSGAGAASTAGEILATPADVVPMGHVGCLAPDMARRADLARRLAVPVVEALDARDHVNTPEPDLLRARVVADVVRLSRAVGEERQGAAKRVGDAGCRRAADDRTATNRELLVSQQA